MAKIQRNVNRTKEEWLALGYKQLDSGRWFKANNSNAIPQKKITERLDKTAKI